MRIVVTRENFPEIVEKLNSIKSGVVAIDTETTGLKWADEMFSLQLAVQGEDSFYFNFNKYPLEPEAPVLDVESLRALHTLWSNSNIRWVAANFKFDLRRIDIAGIKLNGELYDVLLMDRLRYNRHFSYSLDSVLKRMGLAKNDTVSLYIKDKKLYTTYKVEGKKTSEKDLHYDRVPFHIMLPYAMDDAEQTLLVYEDQCKYFQHNDNREQIDLVHSNIELVKTVFDMERKGIQLDLAYCKAQHEDEMGQVREKYDRIEQLTQMKFKAGPKWLTEVFNAQGIKMEMSDKGNPILDKNALKAIPNAVAHYILEVRDHEKRAGTYNTLMRFADQSGVLHTNYRLNGTDTLRFSSNDPNLQNIEACQKDNLSTPRSAFKPRENKFLVSIDYKTMEYRLCADIAGETKWIEAINNGADPHQWVADMMGAERKAAKTLNFMLLYGGGTAKLALALFPCKTNEDTLKAICMVHVYKSRRVDSAQLALVATVPHDVLYHEIEMLTKAQALKDLYFETLPAVAAFTKQVQEVAIGRGFVRNQYGARYYVGDERFAYKMPNHLIQGTGACVIRSAMNKLAYQLEMTKSNMLLQIHDENLFEIDKDELHLIPELRRIMEDEYKPRNGMFLKCDVELSSQSWNANSFIKWEDYVL